MVGNDTADGHVFCNRLQPRGWGLGPVMGVV